MTGEVIALVITFIGAFAMGLVHNPKTLLLGVVMISIGLTVMFFCGLRRGRQQTIPNQE